MLRGNKEASLSARLEASGSAPSQSPSAWVEHDMEKLRHWDLSATNVLHDLDRVTSAAPCLSFPPDRAFGESIAHQGGRAGVAVRACASARAVCLHAPRRRRLAVVRVSEPCRVPVPWGMLNVAVRLLPVVDNPLPSAQETR